MRKKVTMNLLPPDYERIKAAADKLQMPVGTYLGCLILEKLPDEHQQKNNTAE